MCIKGNSICARFNERSPDCEICELKSVCATKTAIIKLPILCWFFCCLTPFPVYAFLLVQCDCTNSCQSNWQAAKERTHNTPLCHFSPFGQPTWVVTVEHLQFDVAATVEAWNCSNRRLREEVNSIITQTINLKFQLIHLTVKYSSSSYFLIIISQNRVDAMMKIREKLSHLGRKPRAAPSHTFRRN